MNKIGGGGRWGSEADFMGANAHGEGDCLLF